MPAIHFRLATIDDLKRNLHRLEPDRPLFDDRTWRLLPDLLADLLARRRIQLVIIEKSETRHCHLLGGTAFVQPVALQAALGDTRGLLCSLLNQVIAGGNPFLSPKEIAVANAAQDLRMFDCFGTPDFAVNPGPPSLEDGLVFNTADTAHRFFNWGYSCRELYQEYASPQAEMYLHGLGYQTIRCVDLPGGIQRKLFRATAEDAIRMPGTSVSTYFRPHQSRLGFSLVEQDVLTLTLLHQSDAEIAQTLDITPDALKKRWRSIYRRVETIEPGQLPRAGAAHLQRLALVKLLQTRLEELRPFANPRSKSGSAAAS